jgi:hypothetical protein
MKTTVKIFACAALASLAFLACNDIGTNANNNANNANEIPPHHGCRTYIAYYDDVYGGPPDDPTLVVIVGDVKDWMDEQLASGGKEQKYISISISDLPLIRNPIEEPVVSGTYDPITGKSTFIVNGQEMTMDEHKIFVNEWAEESMRLRAEIISSYMASVHIPGEEVEERHMGWKALMTAEDIAELAENNEGLTIYFWQEAPYMPVVPITIEIPYERLDPICKSESRELVHISDMHLREVDYEKIGGPMSGGMSVDENGVAYYFLNDEAVSEEEYFRRVDEWQKKYDELPKGKRDLPVPCVIYNDDRTWTALLTEEEIVELQEKYGELVISEYSVDVPTGPVSEGDVGRGGCN